jgi:hypothetical protein
VKHPHFTILLLLLLLPPPAATSARTEDEESREVTPGEQEELPEQLPEQTIPWHESLLELPGWMEQEFGEIQERLRPANQGGGLFPGEVWPVLPEPSLSPLSRNAATGPEAAAQTAPAGDTVPLSPELMKLYETSKPERVFLDPQRLLDAANAGDMESLVQRWLNDQCPFRTKVLVFGRGQQLPSDFDPQVMRRQWFGESDDSLLVLYFLEEPQRTLSIFSKGACATYTEKVLRSTGDAAVSEAARVPGSLEQLERFCYKMSVRLHWLKPLSPDHPSAVAVPAVTHFQWLMPFLWSLAVATGVALLSRFAPMIRRRYRTPAKPEGPVFFPELDSTPRLGAPHSGGFSAVINFSPLIHPEAVISATMQ